MGSGYLPRCIAATAAAARVVGHQFGVAHHFGVLHHTVVAHAHGHHGGIEFVIRFHEARKGHAFTVAKEVLRQAASRAGGSIDHTEVVELQIFGIERFARLVRHVLFAPRVGRSCDDIVAPRAVSSRAVESVSAHFLDLTRLRVERISESRSLPAVVILEVEQISIAIEDEVRAALRLQPVAYGGEGAFVQSLTGSQIHGRTAAPTRLGGHYVTADSLALLWRVRIVREEFAAFITCDEQAACGEGCSQCPGHLISLHKLIIL